MKLHPRSALFWRLYVVGIVQLGLVIVAAVVVGIFVVRMPPPWDTQGLTARLQPLIGRPSALAKALAEFRTRRVSVSLYSPERHLIATNVVPALPLPAWGGTLPLRAAAHVGSQRWSEIARASGSAARLPHRPMFAGLGWLGGRRPLAGSAAFSRAAARPGPPYTYVHFDIGGKAGLLVARFERPLPSAVPPLLTLAAGLLVIFVGAALTARWIARPLGQLSRAARALGRGDFGARTDLKRADELGEVGDAFNEMAGRIQELMLAQKELLANVAHELRTPLARIRVALEIAGESEVDVVNSSLSEIAVDLSELETLIDDVLTATRFELGNGNLPKAQFALHAEEISPNALGERAVERFRTRHPARAVDRMQRGAAGGGSRSGAVSARARQLARERRQVFARPSEGDSAAHQPRSGTRHIRSGGSRPGHLRRGLAPSVHAVLSRRAQPLARHRRRGAGAHAGQTHRRSARGDDPVEQPAGRRNAGAGQLAGAQLTAATCY
jgi:HAMP domain-containing protein